MRSTLLTPSPSPYPSPPGRLHYQRVGADLHMALSHPRMACELLGGAARGDYTTQLLTALALVQGAEPWR